MGPRCPKCGRSIGGLTFFTFLRLHSTPCPHCRCFLSIDSRGRYWFAGPILASFVVGLAVAWSTGAESVAAGIMCGGLVLGFAAGSTKARCVESLEEFGKPEKR